MRRLLGTLIATAALGLTAACGSSSSVATDPASDPAGHPSRTPGPVADAHVLPLISMTGGGGYRSASAVPLDTASEVSRFLTQFRQPTMRHHLRDAIAGAPASSGDLVGQVVAVGCDRPPGADVVVGTDGRVQLVPREVASPLPECLVAVTTVALAVIPPG